MALTRHRCWVYGDSVNTDVIFPGKYTYTLRDPKEIAAHALEDLDPTFVKNVQAGDVIVAGRNWGCGSSREQAVTALKWAGITAIIAESFGGLYFRNCINQGIHPIVCPGISTLLKTGDNVEIDTDAQVIHAAGQTFTIPPLPDAVQAILSSGGLLPMLQRRLSTQSV